MAVNVARQFGFAGTAKHTLTLEELRTVVTDGRHPIEEAVVYKGAEPQLQNLPERVTLRCRVCMEGRIVITRQMLEEMLREDHS